MAGFYCCSEFSRNVIALVFSAVDYGWSKLPLRMFCWRAFLWRNVIRLLASLQINNKCEFSRWYCITVAVL